jgi:glycosyltransferase involved in cell wall biosynthesis
MASPTLLLELVVPVYNEERSLESSVRTLYGELEGQFEGRWRITIADNASTDETPAIAHALAEEFDRVHVVRLEEKGRGRALKQTWLASKAEVVAYVDVDLSTDLTALAPLIAPLLSGHSALAIGTRLDVQSRVVRGRKREFISRSYNAILRGAAGVRFTDAQCGFKAMRTDVAQRLLPLVEDTGWFFDTELLILAERAGLRVHEVPVDWVDDTDSKVDVVATAAADLRGIVRVVTGLVTGRIRVEAIYAEFGRHPVQRPSFFGQVLRFALVGVVSTAAYAVLYLGILHLAQPQMANFLALLITAIANTWANRRFTFGVTGSRGILGHQLRGLLVFGLAWLFTSGALLLVNSLWPVASPQVQLVALTGANLLATVMRFLAFRLWVFRPRRTRAVPASTRRSQLAR